MSPTRLIFLVCCLFYFSQSEAQDFVIDHDMQSNKTHYFRVVNQRDTVKVKSIATKKQSRISLKVENFNPFYWNARVIAVKKPAEDQASNAGAFNPFSLLSKGLGGLVQNIIPDLDLGKISSRGGRQEPEEINDRFLFHAAIYQQLYTRYQAYSEKAENLQLLKLHLDELKYNNEMPGERIKSEARRAVTDELGPEPLTWETSLARGRRLNREFINLSDSLVQERRLLQGMTGEVDKTVQSDGTTIGAISYKVEQSARNGIGESKIVPDFATELGRITETYSQIQAASFSYSYSLNGAQDISELRLQIYPRADSIGKDTITRYFGVKSRSTIKIRNSVGIAFTHFADKNRNYFVKPDSSIGRSSGDLFTPVLSTYINFYPAGSGALKLGGAFGFGIPVTGDRKDINYMLGMSAIIGRNEPVMLTAGVAGTSVSKLANGLKEGDKVPEEDYVLPKVNVFRLGFFVSVSFNLNSVISSK